MSPKNVINIYIQLADRFEKLGSSNEKLENHLLPECKTSQAGIQGQRIDILPSFDLDRP